ncbi:MAG: hypothetical protein JWL82_120 [Parcubacteria group bacterium]|nr:hypothetical protein [Parcubacteria group bacterium]
MTVYVSGGRHWKAEISRRQNEGKKRLAKSLELPEIEAYARAVLGDRFTALTGKR